MEGLIGTATVEKAGLMSISDKKNQSFKIKNSSDASTKGSLLFKFPILGVPQDTNTVFLITGLATYGPDANMGCCLLSLSSHTNAGLKKFTVKVEWIRNESKVTMAYKLEDGFCYIYAKYSTEYIGHAYAFPLKITGDMTWNTPMENLTALPENLIDVV